MRNSSVVLTWPFITSLAILLLNDWIWKELYPGFLTGKLSDLAGISLVALLLGVENTKSRALFYFLIVVTFIWWKSPLSNEFIIFLNSLSNITFGRVVDYSDIFALVVIPLCEFVSQNRDRFRVIEIDRTRIFKITIYSLSGLAIMGTSAIPTKDVYWIRSIPPTKIENTQEISTALSDLLKTKGLNCSQNLDEPAIIPCAGKSIELKYRILVDNSIEISVEAMPEGLFFGDSGIEIAEKLRKEVREALSRQFPQLQYAEPL